MAVLHGDSLAGDWEVGAAEAYRDDTAEKAVGREVSLSMGGVAVIGSTDLGYRVSTIFVDGDQVGLRFSGREAGKVSMAHLSVRAWDDSQTRPEVLAGTMSRTGDESGASPYAMNIIMRRVSK